MLFSNCISFFRHGICELHFHPSDVAKMGSLKRLPLDNLPIPSEFYPRELVEAHVEKSIESKRQKLKLFKQLVKTKGW